MRDIKKLIVHCSATPEGKDFDIDNIRQWHVVDNGWSDVGYHYVIKLDGTVQEGRPIEKSGAHTFGHNKDSIGVCYIGGMDKDMKEWKDTRTVAQEDSLFNLLMDLKFDFPEAKVFGHRDFTDKKPCPSFNAYEEYLEITNYNLSQ
jgi:N-acetylmuramoyl-L-alanine amidase